MSFIIIFFNCTLKSINLLSSSLEPHKILYCLRDRRSVWKRSENHSKRWRKNEIINFQLPLCLWVVASLVFAVEHLVDLNTLNFLLNLEIVVHISHLVGLIMLVLSCTCVRIKLKFWLHKRWKTKIIFSLLIIIYKHKNMCHWKVVITL